MREEKTLYRINSDTPINITLLSKLYKDFNNRVKPMLAKYKEYYDGNQAIMGKKYTDPSKPINRIITNYCDNIVKNYQGYLTGIPVTYTSRDDITNIIQTLAYNDVVQEDSQFLEDALVYGVAYELHWIDADSKTRFSLIPPTSGFGIYDNTLESDLLAFVRFYQVNQFESNSEEYQLELYTKSEIATFNLSSSGNLTLIQTVPHYFKQVPVSVFELNRDRKAIFDKIISLQDAYNSLQSSEIDDFEAFVDAYLVLEGVQADADDLAAMKENRVILLPTGAAAAYLTKNINDTQIENLLDKLNTNIHKISASPDFSDEKFLAQTGVAMRYKLISFENNASSIAANMRKALQKRIELISTILNITDGSIWRDIEIVFTRNLPEDINEKITLVNSLKGVVSDATLLGQVSFVKNVDEELEAVREDKQKNLELYNFGGE